MMYVDAFKSQAMHWCIDFDLSTRTPPVSAEREPRLRAVLPYSYKAQAFTFSSVLAVLAVANFFFIGLWSAFVYGGAAFGLRLLSGQALEEAAKPVDTHHRDPSIQDWGARIVAFARSTTKTVFNQPSQDATATAAANVFARLGVAPIEGWEQYIMVGGFKLAARTIPE